MKSDGSHYNFRDGYGDASNILLPDLRDYYTGIYFIKIH